VEPSVSQLSAACPLRAASSHTLNLLSIKSSFPCPFQSPSFVRRNRITLKGPPSKRGYPSNNNTPNQPRYPHRDHHHLTPHAAPRDNTPVAVVGTRPAAADSTWVAGPAAGSHLAGAESRIRTLAEEGSRHRSSRVRRPVVVVGRRGRGWGLGRRVVGRPVIRAVSE
jgi:hypothetical protein